ncbi:winged helix-turn-helix domain-containing protein [Thalassotalea ganghwensis]
MQKELIKFGPFTFDKEHAQITTQDATIHLEHQQAKLLEYLLTHHRQVLTRDQIADAIWQGVVVEDNTISKAITRLRKTLNDNAKAPLYIKTIPKKGYQFIAHFEQVKSDIQQEDLSDAVVTNSLNTLLNEEASKLSNLAQSNKSDKKYKEKASNKRTVLPFVILLLLCLAVITLWSSSDEKQRQATAQKAYQPKALTYREGREFSGHLHADNSQLLFVGETNQGYAIFYKKLNDATATLLTPINSRKSKPYWLNISDNRFIYSDIDSNGQCLIYLGSTEKQKISSPITSCISNQPVEVFVQDQGKSVIWIDNAGSWRYTLDDKKRQQLQTIATNAVYQAPSPNGQMWLTLNIDDDHTSIAIYDVNTQALRYQKLIPYLISDVRWAKDSQGFFHLSEHPAHQLIQQLLNGDERVIASTSFGSIIDISANQHHQTIEYAISAIDIDIALLTEGNETLLVNSSFPDYGAALSANGKKLAFASKRTGSAQIWLKDENDQFTQLTTFARASYIYDIVWAPNNRHILVKRNSSIDIIDSETHQVIELSLNAEHSSSWQWLSNQIIAFVDQKSHTLFSYHIDDHDQQLLKTNVGAAQYVNNFWYVSDSLNESLEQYDSQLKFNKQVSDQVHGRYWQVHQDNLYLFDQQTSELLVINSQGQEKTLLSNKALRGLSFKVTSNGQLLYQKVSQSEANIYQLHLPD